VGRSVAGSAGEGHSTSTEREMHLEEKRTRSIQISNGK
jgi:hypothetical protein